MLPLREKHAFLLNIFNFFLIIQISFFISLFYCQIATYTENDVQNALADLRNGGALATAATRHGVPRTTLRDRLNSARSCRNAHDDEQRLSTVQEERLERWILRQEALGYALTYIQI